MTIEDYEKIYFQKIKNNCEIVFDIGVADDSIFFEEPDIICHYFEPNYISHSNSMRRNIKNKEYYLNNFALSDKPCILKLYKEGSLYRRENMSDIVTQTETEVRTGLNYCLEKGIEYIDFIKIDVEGFETKVLRGFGDFLSKTKYVQFEYGIGLREAGSNLEELASILVNHGFDDFHINGEEKLENFGDDWRYCNIMCSNKKLIS